MTDQPVVAVLAHACARPPLPGGGRLLSVDGPAGSGKTTLAHAVADSFTGTVELLHMDDMYEGWTGLDADFATRLLAHVIRPFAAGEPGSYRRYDWELGAFAELHVVPPVDLLILEGVGSGSQKLAAGRTTLVWVAAPDDLRIERGIARDRALYEREGAPWDEAAHRERWRGFVADETAYFAANGLPGTADLRVDGTRPLA